jgi:hypothetical protein
MKVKIMKNKLIIAMLILITVCNCKKEEISINLSPKEQLMGKWYIDDPNLWVYEFTPNERIRNISFYRTKIVGLTDSTIYFEKLGSYPPYEIIPYKINKDTLKMDGNIKFFKFKKL